MRRKRTTILATSLLAGCGLPAQPETRQHVVEPAQQDPAVEAAAALARDALHHDRFARGTLYTWTTGDQIDELRRSKLLLVRDESPVNGASYVDQILYILAQRGEPLAKILYTTPFAKMRFAWHTPWATRAGWPNEQYGDQLVRVTLKAEAIIVSLSTATGTFEARNLLNETIPLASVVAKPERIAAIYFLSDGHVGTAKGLPRPTATFREVALCNESMIESWEVGTARIHDELATNARALDAMVRYLRTMPTAAPTVVADAWAKATPNAGPERAFAAALALDSPRYHLDHLGLAQLADQLRATPTPAPFEGRGATFTAGTVRNPPRIVPRKMDTYATYYRPVSPTAAKP